MTFRFLHKNSFKFLKQNSEIMNAQRDLPNKTQKDPSTEECELFLDNVGQHENLHTIKNVIIIGVAFMLHFTAFHGTANLQSSINSDGAIGTYTLAAVYGSLILSNIFLPAAVIRYVKFVFHYTIITLKNKVSGTTNNLKNY